MPSLGLVALLIVIGTAVRWFWRAWRVNVPSMPYFHAGLWATALVLGIVALNQGAPDPVAPWAVGLALMFLYLVLTGAQKVDGPMVNVGDAIPAFTAPADSGETFDSASLAGSGVLLKFFRGHW
jgi:glycerol uptake facilitator-like aquaporin